MTESWTRQSRKTKTESYFQLSSTLMLQAIELQVNFVSGITDYMEFKIRRKSNQGNFYSEVELFVPGIGSLCYGYSPDDFPDFCWENLDEFETNIARILTVNGLHKKS